MQVQKSIIKNPFSLDRLVNNILIRQFKFPYEYNSIDVLISFSTKEHKELFKSLISTHPELDNQFLDSIIQKFSENKITAICQDLADVRSIGNITGYRITRYTDDDELTPYYVWELYKQNDPEVKVYSSSDAALPSMNAVLG